MSTDADVLARIRKLEDDLLALTKIVVQLTDLVGELMPSTGPLALRGRLNISEDGRVLNYRPSQGDLN